MPTEGPAAGNDSDTGAGRAAGPRHGASQTVRDRARAAALEDRARAAQEAKARALADLPEDARAEERENSPEFGDEHTPSATDPANAPVGRGTERPTRARIAWVRQVL